MYAMCVYSKSSLDRVDYKMVTDVLEGFAAPIFRVKYSSWTARSEGGQNGPPVSHKSSFFINITV
jgi:hypothetical protein